MTPLTPEALRARMALHGHDCPVEEAQRLVAILTNNLPRIAALASLPLDGLEPVVELEMDDRR